MFSLMLTVCFWFQSVFGQTIPAPVDLPGGWAIDEAFYTIDSMELKEINVTEDDLIKANSSLELVPKDIPLVKAIDLTKIIFIGRQLWRLVARGKPVVGANLERVSVVPDGIEHWLQLENWKDPVVRKYEVIYRNVYGGEVVRFQFLVTYSYGGQANGKGQFLSEVGFIPSAMTVAWMYNLNVTSEVVRVLNVGTSDNPIAGIELGLNWTVKTPLKEDRRSNHYYIRGDGGFRAL